MIFIHYLSHAKSSKAPSMNLRLPLKITAIALALSFGTSEAIAQGCENATMYPGNIIAPNSLGAITDISTCSYLQEYSAVGPVMANGNYEFTVTGGGYITVREGTASGPVIAEGTSPVTATATSAGNLYAHWNTDASCGTTTGCQTTTVQFLLDCTPPMATVVATDDCANNQFSLDVNVTSLGDATDVDLIYNVNGGADQTLADQQVGTVTIGPFTVGEVVNLTVAHSSDPLCNLILPGLQSGNTCPTIIACGGAPLDQNYCYVNSDNNHWNYQSSTGDALIMIFSAGSIESNTWDHIRIYNGPDNLSPLLYENPSGTTQLAGLQVIATSGEIYMENSSDGSGSCQSGGFAEWVWQVGCLDCTGASATYTINTDCDNYEFSVDVDITDIGSGADLTITNDGGAAPVTVTTPGVYTVGPFTANSPVIVTLENPDNILCNVSSNPLLNPLCPTPVVCGGAPLDATYCYTDNDSHAWHWESSTGGALIMLFSAGSIASNTGDNIRIYDGPDNLSPLLYQNPTGTTQLAGLQVIAPSGHMYMENSSNASNSCASGAQAEWVWQIGCFDCTSASATYTVVTDCDNFEFSVDVDITDIGSGADVTITNNGGAAPVTAAAPGVYTVGPFTANSPVIVTLENPDNVLCNVSSNPLVNPLCPTPVPCGGAPLDETYCYINNDANAWHWESTTGDALIMIFSAGSIESASFDHIRIYNGPDNLSPLLYENPTGTTQLAGLQVIAPSGEIYMENSSDGSVSCQSGSQTEWAWQVGCLDCTGATATYSVNTDCDNFEFSVDVNITDIGSGADVTITNNGGAAPMTVTTPGTYTVGPFTANIPVIVTVENPDNVLCNVSSSPLVNPLCPTPVPCGGAPLDETYCYTNNDSHTWHWESSTGDALIAIFSAGSIESATFDQIRIYDGPDNLSPLLYVNPTGSTTQLAGLQVIAPSGHMYMEVSSEGSVSCQSGSQTEWVWQVGCLDCSGATATYTVVTDCDNFEFSVEVNITNIGSGADATITNNGGADSLTVTTPGVYTVGPFTANIPVIVTVQNPDNVLCNVSSNPLVNPLCPTVIQCGGATLEETYCYINNDSHTWHWQSSGGEPLALQFSAGTIESANWDHLRIYDGPDNLSPLLFDHTQTSQFNLAGLLVISTGPSIYMQNTSDGSGSCQSGGQTEWAWEIGCLDCTNPGATFSIVEDCIHHAFSIAVNIDSLGSGAFARIANSLSTDTLTNVPAGITLVGPFPMDSLVTLTVLNETNDLCRIFSPEFTSASTACVDTVCAATAFEYCYSNSDTAWFAYQGDVGTPLTIEFLWGQLLADDFVQIFNGWDPIPANLLWQGNMNGDMTGWSVNTTNNNHQMLLRIVSNSAYSCATGEAFPPLHWVMQCGTVGIGENMGTDFSMYPNPTTGELSLQLPSIAHGSVDMRVVDLSGRSVHHETFTSTGGVKTFDLAKLQSGNYVVTITTNDWVKSQQLQVIR